MALSSTHHGPVQQSSTGCHCHKEIKNFVFFPFSLPPFPLFHPFTIALKSVVIFAGEVYLS